MLLKERGEPGTVADESIRRAAQEYLAERLNEVNEDGLTYEHSLNRDAAIALAPAVWRKVAETVCALCDEWMQLPRRKL